MSCVNTLIEKIISDTLRKVGYQQQTTRTANILV
jgi:hypothetical protein